VEERLRALEERLTRVERELGMRRRRGRIAVAVLVATVAGRLAFAGAQPSKLDIDWPKMPAWLVAPGGKIFGGPVSVNGPLQVNGDLMLRGPIRVVGVSGQTIVEISAEHGDGAITLKDASGKSFSLKP
jgi:hypothetical protein